MMKSVFPKKQMVIVRKIKSLKNVVLYTCFFIFVT